MATEIYPSSFYRDPADHIDHLRRIESRVGDSCEGCRHCRKAFGNEVCNIDKERSAEGYCRHREK